MNTRTSNSYVRTVDHHSEKGKAFIAALRKYVKAEDEYIGGLSRRVCVKGRMGKNNPNAHKYSVKNPPNVWSGSHSHQTIKLADAAKADLYIYDR
jgi:hypothetical protein